MNNAVLHLLSISLAVHSVVHSKEQPGRPNIVFVMADDLGLGDVGFHRRKFERKEVIVPTPNLDRLAEGSLWFTDGHSSTALCSPTRYCTMSGNLNYRSYAPWGVWGTFRESPFGEGQVTLGTVTRDAGYATAFIGKWHLGGDFKRSDGPGIYRGEDRGKAGLPVDLTRWVSGGPQSLGFQYDFTLPCGIQGPVYLAYENGEWSPFSKDSSIIHLDRESALDPGFVSDKGPGPGDSGWDTRKVSGILAGKAVSFIRGQKKDQPFFLCYWSPNVHLPHCPPDRLDGVEVAGRTPSKHLDTVIEFDVQIGMIVEALKETGALGNTLIVVTSDNGGLVDKAGQQAGHQSNGGFRSNKNSPFEGGHRVPFFVHWPGKVAPGSSPIPVTTHDLLATFAAVAGTDVPADQAMDSTNLLPLFLGDPSFRRPSELLLQAGSKNELIFRDGPWKLVIQTDRNLSKFEPMALFHLGKNPQEKEAGNLVGDPAEKERVQSMLKRYLEIRRSKVPTKGS
ncbi:hypothetical protein HAHE_01180 [Haloferula helveola]|uniref:Sulfatase N-terminal domain-containing protein n=1 Tax=Haloferula helveola TaxID=490095 RepID=A0ABN6GY12_9BACT|nr:hypothetical protein HAHE_01180 [Haloferula helveola]